MKRPILVIALLGMTVSAHAQLLRVDWSFDRNGPVGVVLDPADEVVEQYSYSDPLGAGTAQIKGGVLFGRLKVSAEGTASGDSAAGGGRVGTFWSDTLRIDGGSDLAGSVGFVRIAIDYSWRLAAGAPASTADVYSILNAFGGSLIVRETYTRRCEPTCTTDHLRPTQGVSIGGADYVYTAAPPGRITAIVPFVFGQDYTVDMGLSAEATAYSSEQHGGGQALVFAYRSAYWGGLSEVTDENGVLRPFVVTSASGTDYLHSFAPVPEPPAYVLALVGLGATWLHNRRRRAQLPT